jgi:hypothetical protein
VAGRPADKQDTGRLTGDTAFYLQDSLLYTKSMRRTKSEVRRQRHRLGARGARGGTAAARIARTFQRDRGHAHARYITTLVMQRTRLILEGRGLLLPRAGNVIFCDGRCAMNVLQQYLRILYVPQRKQNPCPLQSSNVKAVYTRPINTVSGQMQLLLGATCGHVGPQCVRCCRLNTCPIHFILT